MSKIISVNAGSSSLKFQLFEMPSETVLTSGIVEKIGFEDAMFTIKVDGEKIKKTLPIPDHTKAVALLLEALVEYKIVNSLDEIVGAGHRAVHGGEIFKESVPVTDDVVAKFASLNDLAPLHNPAGLVGYNAFKENLPSCKHVFVFDTAFHQTMPKESYIYALPMRYYDEYKIRRYGFHGTSHKYVSAKIAEAMGKNIEDLKIITCHLGNGASIAAIKNGKCVDTTMGFTPLEGLVMGTRCGNIDPAVVTYLIDELGYTSQEVNTLMNKKSGIFGVSGVSSDFRDVEAAADKGSKEAQIALDLFRNSVKKYIGAYIAEMNGCDVIVFTAGVGENSIIERGAICRDLEFLGIELDEERNNIRAKVAEISKEGSRIKLFVVPTNEELMIAQDTVSIVSK